MDVVNICGTVVAVINYVYIRRCVKLNIPGAQKGAASSYESRFGKEPDIVFLRARLEIFNAEGQKENSA